MPYLPDTNAFQAGFNSVPDPLERQKNVLALQSAKQQQQVNALGLKHAQQEDKDAQALRIAGQQALDPDGRFNPKKFLQVLPQVGLAHRVPEFQQQFEKTARENMKQGIDWIARRAGTIKDQASWDAAIQEAHQMGIPGVEQMAGTPYNPQTVEQLRMQALSVKEQLDAEDKASDNKRQNESLAATKAANSETARHNKVLEENAAKEKVRAPVPGVDIPLPPAVEQQRIRMNASRAEVNGLSPQQLTKVNSLASQFDSNPAVKNYNEQVNKAQTVKQVVAAGLGGPGDLAVVFEFMKGLDPTSVVRESEYATAAKSGNIFKGALARFNGYFKEEGGFLPDTVKRDFVRILDQKLSVSKSQVGRMHQDFSRRIDKITGGNDGKEYLTDYSTLYDAPAAPSKPGRKWQEVK